MINCVLCVRYSNVVVCHHLTEDIEKCHDKLLFCCGNNWLTGYRNQSLKLFVALLFACLVAVFLTVFFGLSISASYLIYYTRMFVDTHNKITGLVSWTMW